MRNLYSYQTQSNYSKTLERLQKSLHNGSFASYSQQKKQQVWNRLCRYAKQLGIKIKSSLVAACLAAGLSFATPASAQTFVLRTGAANPFDGVDAGTSAAPTFVDIDNDGDKDAFIGLSDGTIACYKNTGTAHAPVFVLQTGGANPLNGIDVGSYVVPTFEDIDNDGDKDLFVGEYGGTITYYKNTGTPSVPVFTLTTGAANPLDGINAGDLSAPAFVDIDNDGDKDIFIGSYFGDITFYKNTGTASSAVFTLQTGAADPFDGYNPGYYSTPVFVDVDGDGDFDAFVGDGYGGIFHYENSGDASSPIFTPQTGAANLFDGADVGDFSAPTFADIDGDGDMDAFIGADDGTITFYENTTFSLPLQLVGFSGSREAGYNQLQWSTAAELNTKMFEIEQSLDGRIFTRLASVAAAGNGSNTYSIKDVTVYNSKVFYRLKMIDIDGRFTYSAVIWINSELAAGVSIYPNPVRNVININVGNEKLLGTRAGIYDVNGRMVQNIILTNRQVQVNAHPLANGMYAIKFADGSGKTFIKE